VRCFFGKTIYHLELVTSTQDVLKELYLNHQVQPGAIVVAAAQSKGRGRRDRTWESRAGLGLWMSVLVQPGDPEEFWTWTPLWAGVVAKRAISKLLANTPDFNPDDLRLKWPNDLMIGEAKLGGILTERVQTEASQGVMLGIGVNLLHDRHDFPPNLQDKAVSLFQVTGQRFSPEALLEKTIEQLELLYLLLNPLKPGLIGELWLNHAWVAEARLTFTSAGQRYEGEFAGLGDHGEIRVKIEDRVQQFANAEDLERLD
jgi:BirA family biotin operon repressor/biotin-[acetyl-CoA-carboxylase] ligase